MCDSYEEDRKPQSSCGPTKLKGDFLLLNVFGENVHRLVRADTQDTKAASGPSFIVHY